MSNKTEDTDKKSEVVKSYEEYLQKYLSEKQKYTGITENNAVAADMAQATIKQLELVNIKKN